MACIDDEIAQVTYEILDTVPKSISRLIPGINPWYIEVDGYILTYEDKDKYKLSLHYNGKCIYGDAIYSSHSFTAFVQKLYNILFTSGKVVADTGNNPWLIKVRTLTNSLKSRYGVM